MNKYLSQQDNRYMDAAISTPVCAKQLSSYQESVEQQSKLLGILNNSLEEIETKLTPVLRPSPPSPANGKCEQRSQGSSQLIEELLMFQDRTRKCIEVVERIREGLVL